MSSLACMDDSISYSGELNAVEKLISFLDYDILNQAYAITLPAVYR